MNIQRSSMENLWNVETFFTHFYHIDRIVQAIHTAIVNRKVKYDTVLNFLKLNRPKRFQAPEDFLYEVFDEEGKFTVESTAYMLTKMGVLKGDCDILFQEEEDQIR